MTVHLATEIPTVPAELAAGTQHGEVTVSAGDHDPETVALQTGARLQLPGNWSRILHHE